MKKKKKQKNLHNKVLKLNNNRNALVWREKHKKTLRNQFNHDDHSNYDWIPAAIAVSAIRPCSNCLQSSVVVCSKQLFKGSGTKCRYLVGLLLLKSVVNEGFLSVYFQFNCGRISSLTYLIGH